MTLKSVKYLQKKTLTLTLMPVANVLSELAPIYFFAKGD